MHVCMLTTTHDLKDDRIFHKEALSLKRSGFDITIVGTGEEFSEEVEGINLISISRTGGIRGRLQVLQKLVDFAVKIDCDAYHFHEPELLYVGKKLKERTGRLVIFDAHEHYPDMMLNTTRIPKKFSSLAAWLMDRWEKHYVPQMDQIVTADDNIEQRYLSMNSHVATIFNYPVLDLFYMAENDRNLERHYSGRDLLIYEGGIAKVRGPLQLLQALNEVRLTHPKVKLAFVGPFTDQQCRLEMEQYIKDNRLEEWVDLVGSIPHTKVPGYIKASKVGLVTLLPVPKFYKNIPIKQFEYMACGIPVIGSDLPPIRSYVQKAGCGLIVDPTCPSQIATAIKQLLDNPRDAERMGEQGREMVAREWNWNEMAQKLVTLYSELVERSDKLRR